MTTGIEFKVFPDAGVSKIDTQNALLAAQEEFFRVTQKFTRFDNQSELSQLNTHNGETYRVTSELFYLVNILLELAAFSDGMFDPTIIDILEVYGYKESFNKEIIKKTIVTDIEKIIARRPSWKQIAPDEKKLEIKLAKDQRLDLGSIGKGYAIDLAVSKLKKISTNFLINAGGDVYALGRNIEKDRNWSTEMRIKINGEFLKIGEYIFDGEGNSLASSGSWARSIGKFHHLINPKTGQPENGILQSFVVHKKATWADGLATVLFLSGEDFIDKLNTTYEAESLLMTKDHKFISSDRFEFVRI